MLATGGLLLTETLIAVGTLAAGVIALGTITNNSISTTILSRDYLIAKPLTDSAVEVVKNLRHTNRLKKPDKKNCWLMLDANCSSFPQPEPVNYVIALNTGLWELKSVGSNELNLDSGSTLNSSPYQLYLENSRYVVKPTSLKTQFFRSVKFTSISDDSATFEVKLQWKDGAKTREIKKVIGLDNSI